MQQHFILVCVLPGLEMAICRLKINHLGMKDGYLSSIIGRSNH